ncbi:MAG: D-glycero-beta-D-manno-heptose 1-phosphate adenylyltransferase [Acidobacteria bacterium]|nr:MAG: D-glycero-beta-D-manno-heptose 1-phosphate adenylyltransferase [Acidobacteriota bacterium]REK01449.1 MAG: D-glycero-beta-D-manno-heptose 1-phosphate adenylyltransferase [Acidobacteriota bacterium]REK14405.1 MAG: D-glycero-beta-D-manno-heptose 1-phosphate adenylyltransferase [Acidobacteriota bacterium]REK45120.1 MAG: D-glycero-beta-D-manno-heptose 1-phosphate adenylyltransferase [Acidobacteriota bacterium]
MKTVFTNGCFDLIHPGHIELLKTARSFGDRLVVGLNSDRSVRSIKGPLRPVNSEDARKAVLEGLESVDEVIIFDELTPAELIDRIKPDVLVKGGDWEESEIIGAETVRSNGGEVRSVPLIEGFSTTSLVEKLSGPGPEPVSSASAKNASSPTLASLNEHREVFDRIIVDCLDSINDCANIILRSISDGNKVLICGNGGSAADAQHIAAEFVGRYETERKALPAVALTTDTSALTALSNDYGFEKVFKRQVEALATAGDVLIAISTSGNSPNVIAAMMKAREMSCSIVGLTGAGGGKFASLCDACVMIPSERTARIQEGHIAVGHIWCEFVDLKLAGSSG